MTGIDKLKEEMKVNSDKAPKEVREQVIAQSKMILDVLIKKCEEDKSFEDKLLLSHKSFERCFVYLSNKARKMLIKGTQCVAVDDATVFSWIYEYYDLDDKAAVERDEKNKERIEREKAKRKEKAEKQNENEPAANDEEDSGDDVNEDEEEMEEESVNQPGVKEDKAPDPVTTLKPKKSKNTSDQLEGQIDIFQMLM